MSIAQFSVKNSVFVNLLMIGIFIFGSIALIRMPTELNPNIDFNWVFVTVVYPGASPVEMESLVVDPIESEIQDVDKIREIQSTADEGFANILVKFEDLSENEFRQRFADLKTEIDKVDLPDEAEDPIVDDFGSDDFVPVINVNMLYSIPEDNAQLIAEEVEEDLLDVKGVARVQVSGLAEREIWIEADPVKMNGYGVTFDLIVMALKARNLNVPGGNISFGKTEYLIRSLGEYVSLNDMKNTVIRSGAQGQFVRLKDVANVRDRREEMTIISRTNGKPSITFSISKKGDANSIDVIDAVKTVIAGYSEKVPDGIEFGFSDDNAVYIHRVINILRNNALFGMFFILGALYLFLGLRNALLVSLGIPISFFLTFIYMSVTGYSLNGSSLFALVMVLGIIVDDAIIVIENCHRHRLLGYNAAESAILGTNEVVKPILSSISTNIAAFLPLILVGGIMGKFLRIVPLVFSLALLASLFEAFFLLPSHYADWTAGSKVYKKGEKKFFILLRKHYSRLLFRVLKRRYWVIAGLFVILLASLAVIPTVGVEMFGDEEFDTFRILVKFPEGTSLEENERIMSKFEAAGMSLPEDEVRDVILNVGLYQGNNEWLVRKNASQVIFSLVPYEERLKTTDELMEKMRGLTESIPGPTSVEFEKVSGGPPVGKPVTVKVQGKYLTDIKAAALALQDSIRAMEGTSEVMDDFPPGKQEIRITVDEEKAALYGFSTQYVALNVRYAFDGIKATEYRDGDEEIDVVVKYGEENRSSVDNVLNLQLTNMQGQTVPLRNIVKFNIQPGPTQINRWDQKRTILVTADIDESRIKLNEVNARLFGLFPKMEKTFPGVSYDIGGQFEEFMEVFNDVIPLFALSLILIFLILGTQFNSYIQPVIILTTVPFALIGAMLGLLISGNPFSIASMYGVVALAGIVVNDAIVMIDFINNRRDRAKGPECQQWRSIVNAGRLRLRPIILTSVTTISGLVPMAFGLGGMSNTWAPLANVILFGLLVSTVLTLFFIPSLVAVMDDVRRKFKGKRTLT